MKKNSFFSLLFLFWTIFTGCADWEITPKPIDLNETRQRLLLSGDEASLYCNLGNRGVKIFEISDPTTPGLLSTYDSPGKAYDIALFSNTLFVADGERGLQIVDPGSGDHPIPKRIGHYSTKGIEARSLTLTPDGTTLFLGTATGLRIVDVSTPREPLYLSRFDTTGMITDLVLSKDQRRLFMVDRDFGLEILDVKEPKFPKRIASFAITGSPLSVLLLENEKYALISNQSEKLHIIDLNDTLHPKLFGEITLQESSANGWAMSENPNRSELYIASGKTGMEIYNIGELEEIRFLQRYAADAETRGLTLSFDKTRLYLAEGEKGIEILDLSTPGDIRPVGSYRY